MAFYKVIKNGSVIDVLDHITYVKWNQRHMKPYLSTETEAEGFLSQDHKKVYAVYGMRQNSQHVFDHVDDLVENIFNVVWYRKVFCREFKKTLS